MPWERERRMPYNIAEYRICQDGEQFNCVALGKGRNAFAPAINPSLPSKKTDTSRLDRFKGNTENIRYENCDAYKRTEIAWEREIYGRRERAFVEFRLVYFYFASLCLSPTHPSLSPTHSLSLSQTPTYDLSSFQLDQWHIIFLT